MSRILAVAPSPNAAAGGRGGVVRPSRCSPRGLSPFIGHLPFDARCAELSNDDAAECRQRLLTLFVRQPRPKLSEDQRDRRARGGTKVVATWDMDLLLESGV